MRLPSRLLRALLGPFGVHAFASPEDGPPEGSPPEATAGASGQVATAIYRSLMAHIPQGAVICDLEGELLDANARAAPLLGIERAILEGLPFPTALEEAGLRLEASPFGTLRQALPQDHPLALGPYPLGSNLSLSLHTFRVGGATLVLALIQGTAGAEGAGEARSEPDPSAGGGARRPAAPSEAKALLDVVDQGLLLLDARGTILGVNGAAADLLGRSTDKLRETPLDDLVTALNPEGWTRRLLDQTRNSGRWTGVLKLQQGSRRREIGVRAATAGDDLVLALRDLGEDEGPAGGLALPLDELLRAFGRLWESLGEAPPGPEAILQEVGPGLDYDLACVEIHRPERGEFELTALHARQETRLETGVVVPEAASTSSRVLETGQDLFLEDLQAEQRYEDLALYRDFASGLKLPLPSGDGPFGVLSLWSRQKDHFRREHRDAARLLASLLVASHLARKLKAARGALEEARQGHRIRATAIDRVDQGVLTLDEEGRIQWWNQAALRLTGLDAQGLRDTFLGLLVAREEREALVERVGRGPWEGRLTLAPKEGRTVRVEASLRGTAGDARRGVPVTFVFRDCTAKEHEEQRAEALARQLETAERLLSMDTDARDLADFLQTYASELAGLLEFQEAQVYTPSQEGEALVLQAAANASRARLERSLYFPREGTRLGAASTEGEALVLADLSEESGPDAIGLQEEGFRSAAVLPLALPEDEGGGAHALLVLLSAEESRFSSDDLALLGPFTGPLVRALERHGPAAGRLPGGMGA